MQREREMQMKQAIKYNPTNPALSLSPSLSPSLSLSLSLFKTSCSYCFTLFFFFNSSPEHKEGADWRKAVPSYTQSSSMMDYRTWSSLPRDDSLEPLPFNWEMAYTETGMVYFIE